jgi:hypothetical protein
VPTSNLARNALSQISEATNEPVLVKDANAIAVWLSVSLDHAELSMNGPEYEKYDEHVMSVPESFEIGTSAFLHGSQYHCHQGSEHDIS